MAVKKILREEFRLKHVWLNFHHHEPFYTCQWKWPSFIFLIYRILFACYTFGALIQYAIKVNAYYENAKEVGETAHHTMAFLTTWSYIILTTHFNMACAICVWSMVKAHKSGKSEISDLNGGIKNQGFKHTEEVSEEIGNTEVKNSYVDDNNTAKTHPDEIIDNRMKPTPWYSKISWILANIISVWAVIVSLIYYIALFPSNGVLLFHDVNVHLMNSVIVLIDTALCARPVRILHVIYPVIYGLTYLVFSLIYWSMDPVNNVLYPVVLDWNNAPITLGVGSGLLIVVIPSLQMMFFGLYRLKLYIFKKIYKHEYLDVISK